MGKTDPGERVEALRLTAEKNLEKISG